MDHRGSKHIPWVKLCITALLSVSVRPRSYVWPNKTIAIASYTLMGPSLPGGKACVQNGVSSSYMEAVF